MPEPKDWPAEAFKKLAEQRGVSPEDLDEAVHDAASKVASRINNGGLEHQLEYLYQQWGWDELKSFLESLEDTEA